MFLYVGQGWRSYFTDSFIEWISDLFDLSITAVKPGELKVKFSDIKGVTITQLISFFLASVDHGFALIAF